MSQLAKKCAAIGFLVLVSLWIVGIVREAALPYPQPAGWHLASSDFYEELSSSNAKNPGQQRMANNLVQIGLAHTPLPLVLEQADVDKIQVYEKNAQLAAGTEAFEPDEASIRAALAAHLAVVFNEKMSGIAPQRRLALEIGVHPEQFDALVQQLQQIAQLQSVSVQMRDRTGDFRRLHAQRQSLKQHLESVLKLRGVKAASIDDELKLEQKIQDIEKELQSLAVQMGDLLGKQSFYHVYVILSEYQPGSRLDRTYAMPQRLAHAFVWALGWWLALALAAVVLAATGVSIRTLWPSRSGAGR